MFSIRLICASLAFLAFLGTKHGWGSKTRLPIISEHDHPTIKTSVALSVSWKSSQCRQHHFQQFRTLNGFCNNLRSPRRGAAHTPFILNTLTRRNFQELRNLPSSRKISNMVCDEAKPKPNERGMSELVIFFGQLLDHTFAETKTDNTQPMHIEIPRNDPVFHRAQYIPFFRTKKSRGSPINELSSFIDASSVYGTSTEKAKTLREMRGGRLKLPGNLLPRDKKGQFIAGDSRVNENPNLIALHLIFAREHNTVAAEVARAYPYYNDEQIYQLARHIVAAEMQAITYYEFIPALTGQKLPKYRGYDPNVRATVSNQFATVAYRVGHTMVNRTVTFIKGSHRNVDTEMLRDVFFKPKKFIDATIEGLFRGMMSSHASEIDNGVVSEVRNFLIDSPTRSEQLDLVALNIQRGRDNGVPSCNDLRRSVGLSPFRYFDEVVQDGTLARNLRYAYNGNINDVDAWVCGVCEAHEPGSSLGALFHRIIRREFQGLRDGDRFYFERHGYFKPHQIRKIATIRKLIGTENELGFIMSRLIQRNTGISEDEISYNDPFFV